MNSTSKKIFVVWNLFLLFELVYAENSTKSKCSRECSEDFNKKLFVSEIQAGNIDGAFETYAILSGDISYEAFAYLITKTYDCKVDNVENIMKFSEKVSHSKQVDILSDLYEEMVKNHHLDTYQVFEVADRVKQLMNTQPLSPKLVAMKEKFPVAVRTIIFDSENVCIKTPYFAKDEYFFAQNDSIVFDKDRRYVFTNRENNLPLGAEKVWVFEPAQSARYFSIKSKMFDEYLYGAANAYSFDSYRRRIFTWRPKTEFDTGEWELSSARNGTAVHIKQRLYRECIFPYNSGKFDEERREVFTWRDPRDDPKKYLQYDWLIEPCH